MIRDVHVMDGLTVKCTEHIEEDRNDSSAHIEAWGICLSSLTAWGHLVS